MVKDKLNEKAEFLQMRFSLFFLTIQKCLADTNKFDYNYLVGKNPVFFVVMKIFFHGDENDLLLLCCVWCIVTVG